MQKAPASWQRLTMDPVSVCSAALLTGLGLAALLAPLIAPHDPAQVHLGPSFAAPGGEFVLGTDAVGRDCLSRLLWGARISLPLGLLAVAVATVVGTLVGATAGFVGGRTDQLLSWSTDLFLALPRLVLLMAVVALFRGLESGHFLLVALVLGLTGWMPVARLARGQVLSLRQRGWVRAARGLGLSPGRILWLHLLPHALPPVLVHASLLVGGTILVEAALSFLGLGVPPPTPSWGNMIAEGMRSLQHWWLTLFPGLAITVTVAAFNLLGDGLRDALDPSLEEGS